MKGYNIDCGYMGWTGYNYTLFDSEMDYKECYLETNGFEQKGEKDEIAGNKEV